MSSWLSLIVHLLFCVITIHEVMRINDFIDKAADRFFKLWRMEYELRLCGEQLASINNLKEAAEILMQKYPSQRQLIADEKEHLIQSFLEEDFCLANHKYPFQVYPYRQHNPELSDDWPNWYFKFIGTK